jgi:TPR repeat protein
MKDDLMSFTPLAFACCGFLLAVNCAQASQYCGNLPKNSSAFYSCEALNQQERFDRDRRREAQEQEETRKRDQFYLEERREREKREAQERPRYEQERTESAKRAEPAWILEKLAKIQTAAEKGNADAQYKLGSIYDGGYRDIVSSDREKAAVWYRKAAEQGHAEAQCKLGLKYEIGFRPDRRIGEKMSLEQDVIWSFSRVPDLKEAEYWYRKAAEQGNFSGTNSLSLLYPDVPPDYKKVLSVNRKAAKQGDADAMMTIGMMYATGKGVPKDDKEAAVWFRNAAEQGHEEAIFQIGMWYAKGRGVPQSKIVAYAILAFFGDGDSLTAYLVPDQLTRLAAVMSNAEIEAAQALARELAKPRNFGKALDAHIKSSARPPARDDS